MKAVVLKEFGAPEVLRLEEAPTPSPARGEVLVEVRSVSVNRTLDLVVRAGKYPSDVKLPLVLGVDPAGIVVARGEGVTQPEIGERVAVVPSFRAAPAASAKPKRSRIVSAAATSASTAGAATRNMSLFRLGAPIRYPRDCLLPKRRSSRGTFPWPSIKS